MLGIDPKAARATWTVAAIAGLVGAVYLIRSTLFVFAIALMFAYLLYPLFDSIDKYLSRTGAKAGARTQALALTYFVVLVFLIAFAAYIGANVGSQAAQLAKRVTRPDIADQVRQWRVLNLPVGDQINRHYDEIVAMIPELSVRVLEAGSNLIYVIVIPIMSFFLLKDGRHALELFLEAMGPNRDAAMETVSDAHTLMLQYMRALFLLCLAVLISFSVVLSLMKVPYAILLAAIAFPLEFVPLVGPLISGGIIVGVSLFSGYPHVSWVVAFLLIYRFFQDYVLSPHLMSKGVELHPMLVILGVFAGGEIGGVGGIFLSVPAIALLRLLYYRLWRPHTPVAAE
jgi:predicted PurR-regulated permease PerM